MILSDHEIKARVAKDKLLEYYDPAGIKYCGYELTLGKVVEPNTGNVLSLDGGNRWWRSLQGGTKCFVIEPSETMLIITKEKLNIPNDLCATYGQLNRWANKGLMILNTSIVEPGYSGPLSCVLVNFSLQRITLSPGEAIAKLNFQTIQGVPDLLFTSSLKDQTYEQMASKTATNLPKSLLDISGVEERVTKKVNGAVQASIRFGGLIILILLLWSQMEGFLSDWIYNRTGMMTTTKQVEILLKQQQVEFQNENLKLRQDLYDLKRQTEQTNPAKGGNSAAKK